MPDNTLNELGSQNASELRMQRSDELDEIISLPPSWIIRWGTTVFFIILLTLVLGSWLIHYPDLVQVPVQFTTFNAPKPIKVRQSGKIAKLLVGERDVVHSGQILAYMESTANHAQVLDLASELDTLNSQLEQSSSATYKKIKPFTTSKLGELQPAYQTFQQAYTQHISFKKNGFFTRKRRILLKEITDINLLNKNLLVQQEILKHDLDLSMQEFAAQKTLITQRVISSADFRKEESRIVPKELAIRQNESSVLQNDALRTAKQKELLEVEKLANEEEDSFRQALNTLRSAVDNWKSNYFLIAPIAGTIFFSTILEENQTMLPNQEAFYIDPQTTLYYATTTISQNDIGKVKFGQEVLIKLAAYPAQEFGIITGRIGYISEIPSKENNFLAKITLPNKLTTTYGKRIPYRNGISASANIVTRDSRLIEKIFYSFKKALSR